MIMNFKEIINAINDIKLIRDGKFNSLSLLNGKLKKDNMLLAYIEDEKYISDLMLNEEITCVICKDTIVEQVLKNFNGGVAATKMPRSDFFRFHNYLNRNTDFYKNHIGYFIDESAVIDKTVVISNKNVRIGKNTIIKANVVIYENTIIGDNVIIMEGTVIGSPAFYYYDCGGNNEAVDSVGGVIIKNNVSIHPNVVVGKGTLGGNTEIGNCSKIDSNTYVAHDVRIYENCLITGGIVLSGIVTIKNNTFLGIGTKVVPMATVGENCYTGIGSIVIKDIPNNLKVFGNPATARPYDKTK